MAITVQPSAYLPGFSKEDLDAASTYNGQRVTLRKEVCKGSVAQEVLEHHTELMIENRDRLRGILFKVTPRSNSSDQGNSTESKVYLMGAPYMKIGDHEHHTPEQLMSHLSSLLPDQVKHMLHQYDLYVEWNLYQHKSELQQIQFDPQKVRAHWPTYPKENLTPYTPFITSMDYLMVPGLMQTLLHYKYQHGLAESIHPMLPFDALLNMTQTTYCQLYTSPEVYATQIELGLELLDALQWENIDSMTQVVQETDRGLADLITQTNLPIITILNQTLASGKGGLFALGIVRLIGEDNIISYLKQSGYAVEQIPIDTLTDGSMLEHGNELP